VDARGVQRFPGSEVRIYAEGQGPEADREREGRTILGTRLLDAGGGYCSQGVTPVHFALPPGIRSVVVEITVPDGGVRRTHAVRGVPIPMRPSGVLEIRLPEVF
jgi:hypothetical protein